MPSDFTALGSGSEVKNVEEGNQGQQKKREIVLLMLCKCVCVWKMRGGNEFTVGHFTVGLDYFGDFDE